MPDPIKLTPQQTAVVRHNTGPALVFAVAGAGKTTAMVHRIARLVEEGVFPPAQILATSFGRANVRDLQRALRPWPACRAVAARTLHALGRDVIKLARRRGHLRHLTLNVGKETENLSQQLLNGALSLARRQKVSFEPELEGIDRGDFLDYVGFCKGNLLYPDLDAVSLPAEARQIAGQAPPPPEPLGWYVDLYQIFESVREERGIITFDDMLLTGWEALVRFPDVLTAVQKQYRCVVVDEFQDINLAQSEILDLIARPHGNYMAVGDDDQTIYEWRGADPRFILDFTRRYGAKRYLISENFRCPAGPLTLANAVIRHNKHRERKRLRLTRGFTGRAELEFSPDVNEMSVAIRRQIETLHEAGTPLSQMAILVRLNAQTPPLEQQLIAAGLPYRVRQPFYERPPIKTLIHYGRLAWIDRALRQKQSPLTNAAARRKFSEAWRDVSNRPKRYLSYRLRDELGTAVIRRGETLSRALRRLARTAAPDWLADKVEPLADDLAWLSRHLDDPAGEALAQLEKRLDYRQFLRESSGFPETGEGRAAGVTAFLHYAQGRGTFLEFMGHIRELAQRRAGQREKEAVTIATIHQAKGREWPVVFLAQCNQSIMPFNPVRTADVEEERRLFYVAVTRSQRDLLLHATQDERVTRFLREAKWERLLPAMRAMQETLERDPATWEAAEALALARGVKQQHLGSYFEEWWPAGAVKKAAVSAQMDRFFTAVSGRGWLSALDLSQEQASWWRQWLPPGHDPAAASDFPGLAAIRPRSESGKATPISDRAPETIRPGMWLQCDAGWGRIEQVMDRGKRPLSSAPRDNDHLRLRVILRPEGDAVPVEIDIAMERILFLATEKVYVCTKCGRFATPEVKLVVGKHNDVAHNGVGPRYRRIGKRSLDLTFCRYRTGPPGEVWG